MKYADLNSTPNRNGNTAESLVKSLMAVSRAAAALDAALLALQVDVLHGRNYQTLASPAEDRADDVNTVLGIAEATGDVRNWAVLQAIRMQELA